MADTKKVLLMDDSALTMALTRMAHEIVERNGGLNELCIVGICNRGVPLAQRLRGIIERVFGTKVPMGILDIAFYRDDLTSRDLPNANQTNVPFNVDDKSIVLVDDVMYTGRTARAAMDAIMDMGRPKVIRYAVLVDRGHRELPICPDFVGKVTPTSHTERVSVRLVETDGVDEVILSN